jgi:hypothetical protein
MQSCIYVSITYTSYYKEWRGAVFCDQQGESIQGGVWRSSPYNPGRVKNMSGVRRKGLCRQQELKE